MEPDDKRKVVFQNNKVESKDLFSKTHELIIIHNDEEYKLRITGNKKLILTK
ncbi:hemin uptake protein HemP [Curvivirga sp.]|uniref:hemin uptake protein HemP n=1 Tax=Curvivirga sp. TaxID=2856848 RepID=UPI003B5C200C